MFVRSHRRSCRKSLEHRICCCPGVFDVASSWAAAHDLGLPGRPYLLASLHQPDPSPTFQKFSLGLLGLSWALRALLCTSDKLSANMVALHTLLLVDATFSCLTSLELMNRIVQDSETKAMFWSNLATQIDGLAVVVWRAGAEGANTLCYKLWLDSFVYMGSTYLQCA